jgi:hypothetical protein
MCYRRKKGRNMGAVLSLQQHIDKKHIHINRHDLSDIFVDPNKKREADRKLNKISERHEGFEALGIPKWED